MQLGIRALLNLVENGRKSVTQSLSDLDRTFLNAMLELGILTAIPANLLEASQGAVFHFCGDCDHSVDKVNRFVTLLERAGSQIRPHLLAINGGAIWLPYSELVSDAHLPVDEVMLSQISGSLSLKEFDHLFLEVHAPCGAARVHKMSFFDCVEFVLAGKERVKNLPGIRPGVKVYTLMHVFDSTKPTSDMRKTWLVDSEKWNQHCESLRRYDSTPNGPRLLEMLSVAAH